MADPFDPRAVLLALDEHQVDYVVIGAIARIVHGSGEITNGIDICPSTRPGNLRRVDDALRSIGGAHAEGNAPGPVRFVTPVGPVNVVVQPAGTQGFDDLRRHADRLDLGERLRPRVASVPDLIRSLEALTRDDRDALVSRLRLAQEIDGRTRSRRSGPSR